MIKLSKRALAINIGAGTIIAVALVSFMQSTFLRPNVEVCSRRYHRQVVMQLARDGALLTPQELQAFANGQDEGLAENLTIAEFSQGPARYALGVKIAKNTVEQRSTRGTSGGISLPWAPSILEQPTSACLSYDVFFPTDFDFNAGGTLPGLFGVTSKGQYGDTPHFAANLAWHFGGVPRFYLATKASDDDRAALFPTYQRILPRGRWVHVEQELILNTPGRNDGIARLWLDGRIESEVKNAWIRSGADVAITGVSGEVYFGGSGTTGTATADSTVWLSPFDVRWN